MYDLRPAPYQIVALTKLLRSGADGILIADGVGVGKTIAAGYILRWILPNLGGVGAVACPPGLVSKWLLELRRKLGVDAFPIRSREELSTARAEIKAGRTGHAYVLPYSLLKEKLDLDLAVVVVDEIHNMRNADTQIWEHARTFALNGRYRVGLSATPINNSIEDLGNIYALLLPQYHESVVRAAVAEIWAESRYDLVHPVLTRFTKEKLGIHFARRQVESVRVAYSEQYVAEVQSTITKLLGKRPEAGKYPIEAITFFREAASSPVTFAKSTGARIPQEPDPKLVALQAVLLREPKVLVFCQFRQTAEYLSEKTTDRPAFVLTGDVPMAERDALIESFRTAETAVIYLTAVGTEGLDFQFCDAVVNYDLHWNPMVLEQRIGRIDRIGQLKSEIRIYNFHVTGSIDDRVLSVLARKLADVSGTPLAPPPITEDYQELYDSVSEEAQLIEARKTIDALRLSDKLRTPDLVALPAIAREACDPLHLQTLPALAWVAGAEGADWLRGIDEGSQRLQALINGFQRVVNSGDSP